MDDLKVKNMTSAGGTHKRGLNREVLAQTWGMIRQQLEYKAEWAGRKLVKVNLRTHHAHVRNVAL